MGEMIGGVAVLVIILGALFAVVRRGLRAARLDDALRLRRESEEADRGRREAYRWEELGPDTPIRVVVAGVCRGEVTNGRETEQFDSISAARAVYPELDLEKDSDRFLRGSKVWWGEPVVVFRTPYYAFLESNDGR